MGDFMKKIISKIVLGILLSILSIKFILIYLVCFSLGVGLYEMHTQPSELKREFNISKEKYEVITEYESERNFLGDGEDWLILDCSNQKDLALEEIRNWKPLPMSEDLYTTIFGGKKGDTTYGGYGFVRETNLRDVKNGYYLFLNRSSEDIDKYSEENIFDHYFGNFSLGIYDTDTNKLYYFKYDS